MSKNPNVLQIARNRRSARRVLYVLLLATIMEFLPPIWLGRLSLILPTYVVAPHLYLVWSYASAAWSLLKSGVFAATRSARASKISLGARGTKVLVRERSALEFIKSYFYLVVPVLIFVSAAGCLRIFDYVAPEITSSIAHLISACSNLDTDRAIATQLILWATCPIYVFALLKFRRFTSPALRVAPKSRLIRSGAFSVFLMAIVIDFETKEYGTICDIVPDMDFVFWLSVRISLMAIFCSLALNCFWILI